MKVGHYGFYGPMTAANHGGAGTNTTSTVHTASITGFTNYEFTIGGIWLATLKQIAPHVSRVMVILNPSNPTGPGCMRGGPRSDPLTGY